MEKLKENRTWFKKEKGYRCVLSTFPLCDFVFQVYQERKVNEETQGWGVRDPEGPPDLQVTHSLWD